MIAADPVIIVHGLWTHGLVMGWMARHIRQGGFDVHSFSYPSMRLTLQENAERLAQYCGQRGVRRVNIVAHSMGGLVALKMLETSRHVQCGRLVLTGTPYTGSYAATRLARLPGGKTLLGKSIAEWLGSARPSISSAENVGVIAGTRGIGVGRLVAPDLPQPNDGVVTLAETQIPGVTQRITLPVSHSEMLVSRAVARQCCAFLRNGRFAEDAAA